MADPISRSYLASSVSSFMKSKSMEDGKEEKGSLPYSFCVGPVDEPKTSSLPSLTQSVNVLDALAHERSRVQPELNNLFGSVSLSITLDSHQENQDFKFNTQFELPHSNNLQDTAVKSQPESLGATVIVAPKERSPFLLSLGSDEALCDCPPKSASFQVALEEALPSDVFQDATPISELSDDATSPLAESVLKLLALHADNDETLEVVLTQLESIIVDDENMRTQLSEGGIISLLLSLSSPSLSSVILEFVCSTFAHLARDNDCRLKLGSDGVVEALVSILQARTQDESICEYACQALANIATDDGNKSKLDTVDVCTALVSGLLSHSSTNSDVCSAV